MGWAVSTGSASFARSAGSYDCQRIMGPYPLPPRRLGAQRYVAEALTMNRYNTGTKKKVRGSPLKTRRIRSTRPDARRSRLSIELDKQRLRKPQGPRSGVNAVFGRLANVESDEAIIEALDRLS